MTKFDFYALCGKHLIDNLSNKYEMITYFESFEEDELHFLRKTLPKFNEYFGEYL
jgi:hypothetical protein